MARMLTLSHQNTCHCWNYWRCFPQRSSSWLSFSPVLYKGFDFVTGSTIKSADRIPELIGSTFSINTCFHHNTNCFMSLIKTNMNNCHHYKAIHRLFQMWDINILLMVKLSCTTCREAYPNICRMLAETVQCLFCTHKIHYLRNNFDSNFMTFLA
jgi:hypothetical protein